MILAIVIYCTHFCLSNVICMWKVKVDGLLLPTNVIFATYPKVVPGCPIRFKFLKVSFSVPAGCF